MISRDVAGRIVITVCCSALQAAGGEDGGGVGSLEGARETRAAALRLLAQLLERFPGTWTTTPSGPGSSLL